MRHRVALLAFALVGCGARTGLLDEGLDAAPDVAHDAAVVDALDVTAREVGTDVGMDVTDVVDVTDVAPDAPSDDGPDVCVERSFSLPGRAPQVVLLLDRSASMNDYFPATSGRRTRANGLTLALRGSFARFDGAFEVGVLMFPNAGACAVRLPLDLPLGQGTSARAADLYVAARTETGTPTHDAVRLAEATLLAARQDVPRAILLATDGGPVCNESLDGQDCICTAGILSRRPCETRFCLDDTRTLATIAAARDRGIPTYVIGIDDPRDPVLRDTLDRMATAGGRRRAGPVGYYSAQSMEALDGAFESIRRSLARCARVAPPGLRRDAVRVWIDDREVPRDPARGDGWDWQGAASNELLLFGAACEAVTERSTVRAVERCGP